MISYLEKVTQKFLIADLPRHSRIHPLQSFHTSPLQCYIKRDDELGLMGSKMRKFSSLITYMLQKQIDEAVVIGGANSNHVLGITQLLIEKNIKPRLFLCESKQEKLKGNALLTKLLVPENQIQWIERQQWQRVHELALVYANEQPIGKKVFIIPEGGCMPEALPGALTLACDIIQNEKDLGSQFDHFFVDSGSGMMAIALILGLAFIQHPGHVHVVLIAGNQDEFLDKLKIHHQHLSSLMEKNCPWPVNFSLSKPHQAKAFGATTAETFKTIQQMAQEEGVLCDPIYNAKLFGEAKRKILTENLVGKALIIQSGGTLSLLGFL